MIYELLYVPSNMCAQRIFRSVCAFAQSDQSRRCPHQETLHSWLSKMHPDKILIRLRANEHMSEDMLSDLAAYMI